MNRQEAYAIVQRNAMASWKTRRPFLEILLEDPAVTASISEPELRTLFDYNFYLQNIGATFERLGL
jgi:adenylosuccinate lyase